ncbi:MAG: S26 family signal peptidase [Patescibacteria group bacterium]
MKFLTSLFPLLKFRIEENSMSPFLNQGDLVIIFRTKNVKKTDVVVFEKDEDFYIKRVSKLEDSRYFLEGDNKKESKDSRKFGWIPKQQIVGKVVYKF